MNSFEQTMQAMVLEAGEHTLKNKQVPVPAPASGQVLIRVHKCAVCRTDLHVVDGDLAEAKRPVTPGHEVIGTIVETGKNVDRLRIGDRVGVAWLGMACGDCRFCQSGRENLCGDAKYTGYTLDGGFAEFMLADPRFCFAIPDNYSDEEAAPLMCAGLIGYRSLAKAGEAKRLGLYGFGAAAHIIAQVAAYQGRDVYAFTKPGDAKAQQFARESGAVWAGDSTERSPVTLDAAIIFAPIGALLPAALRMVDKGGRVVCAGIHMSDIPSFPYGILWGERQVLSVANLTRIDGESFLKIAAEMPIKTSTRLYPLQEANTALEDLRHGRFEGAAVLDISERH